MKKYATVAIVILMIATLSVPAFAATPTLKANEIVVEPSEIVSIREDVTVAEASNDIGFSIYEARASRTGLLRAGATWETGGSNIWSWVGGSKGAKPSGWSQQRNDSTGKIENTYHYTNTYYAYLGSKRGESGRVWGNGKVTATGTWCYEDEVNLGVHNVKYGINND